MADDPSPIQRARDHYSRGSIAGFLGENEKGVAEFSGCIALDPRNGYAYSLRGYLHGVIGQFDLAQADHESALALVAEIRKPIYEPWVLQHYADLWRRRGEFEKALALCERALKLQETPHVHLQAAWIRLDMKQPAQAKAEFQKFERVMRLQGDPYSKFWREERRVIERLRQLP
jgi:tetratricopeptide (TPR) repeat protein